MVTEGGGEGRSEVHTNTGFPSGDPACPSPQSGPDRARSVRRPEKQQEARRPREDPAGLGRSSPSTAGAGSGGQLGPRAFPGPSANGGLASPELTLDGAPHPPCCPGRPRGAPLVARGPTEGRPRPPLQAPEAWHSSRFPAVPSPAGAGLMGSPAGDCVLPAPRILPGPLGLQGSGRPPIHPQQYGRLEPPASTTTCCTFSAPLPAPRRPRVKPPPPPTTPLPGKPRSQLLPPPPPPRLWAPRGSCQASPTFPSPEQRLHECPREPPGPGAMGAAGTAGETGLVTGRRRQGRQALRKGAAPSPQV